MLRINYTPNRKSLAEWDVEDKNAESIKKLEERVSGFGGQVRLTLNDGDILLVAGPNGSGKTTFLQQVYLSLIGKYGSAGISASKEKREIFAGDMRFFEGNDINPANWGTFYADKHAVMYSDFNVLMAASDGEYPGYASMWPEEKNEYFHTTVFTFSDDAQYVPFYFDGTLMGVPASVEFEKLRWGVADGYKTYFSPLSHRMWHEQIIIAYVKELRKQIGDQPIMFLLDEPENGLDPQQQLGLAEQIAGHLQHPKDVAMVATNSLTLYYSDLPRLDLGSEKPFRVSHESKRVRIE